MEHYLPARVTEKLDLSCIKEVLSKLHNTYAGDSEKETELKFLKLCQRLTEYGVHFHQVHPEKSQTGILLGVCSKGVQVFEVYNGVLTLVLHFPWKEAKISFSKKKIIFQNTSDEIKHAFRPENNQTENSKYLLHLCSAQHKFQLQM